ncbi:MAG: hypothetical protein M0Q22_07525 [Sulfuritalea sp.]|jgi:hypothetical protein|nr:hypothetical protein [Sulfuritalea sp.]
MSAALLAELTKLQRQRSDSSPFVSHVEFHTWADKVLPLLSFDQKLYTRFRSIVLATNSARVLEAKQQEVENINTAIGILNQAIVLLENPPPQQLLPMSSPDKITLKWLYQHAPIQFYIWSIGLLVSAATLGFAAGVQYSLITTANPSSPLSTKAETISANPSPTAIENTKANDKAAQVKLNIGTPAK